jgi:hypothetical protein
VTGHYAHDRERAASIAQYILLGGFAAVAAGISAQGLTGFARSNMELTGAWPYLLFFALDGAAGVCAVLLVRRAARAESALAPRLAVWGLVAASSAFNWTHAPHRPAAAEAFGLMPVVAALLFEFCLRELRLRTRAERTSRKLSAWRLLQPAELIRVRLRMAADERASVEEATRHVRVNHAARRLYQLKAALDAHDQPHTDSTTAGRRIRKAEHRAHRALTRAGFTHPSTAAAVLRQVQLLTMTSALARLDYRTPDAAQEAIANLIVSPFAAEFGPDSGSRTGRQVVHDGTPDTDTPRQSTSAHQINGCPVDSTRDDHARDAQLVAAATRIVAAAAQDGSRLTQAALASRLRREGYTVANNRLHWLSSTSGLEPCHAEQPDWQPPGGP